MTHSRYDRLTLCFTHLVRPAGTGVFSPVVNAVGGGRVDHILMSSLRQVGDVVLVHDENAVERRWSSYGLQTVVGCDVVTERGTYIGRVRDFEYDPEDGLVQVRLGAFPKSQLHCLPIQD